MQKKDIELKDLVQLYISLDSHNPLFNKQKLKEELEKTIFVNAIMNKKLTTKNNKLALQLFGGAYLYEDGQLSVKTYVSDKFYPFKKCDFSMHENYNDFVANTTTLQNNLKILKQYPLAEYQYFVATKQLNKLKTKKLYLATFINKLNKGNNFSYDEIINKLLFKNFFTYKYGYVGYNHDTQITIQTSEEIVYGKRTSLPQIAYVFKENKLKEFIQNINKEYVKINDFITKDNNLENLFFYKKIYQRPHTPSPEECINLAITNFHKHILSNLNQFPKEIEEFLKFYKII